MTANLDKIATDFLVIVPAKRLERASKHIQTVLTAYADGEIYNVVYKEAKDYLGRCAEEGYKARTGHFTGWDTTYPEQQEANSGFSWYLGHVMGLHSTISLHKKLAKLKPTTTVSKHTGAKASEVSPEFIQAAQEVADAAQPLALLFKELKSKIVKGRKPNPEALARKAAELAKKDMKTCACCFRAIARLKNGLIADHGFTLPYQGWGRQGSCPGGDFRPLEVSDDGLKYMVNGLKGRVAQLTEEFAAAPNTKVITRSKNYWSKETEEITSEHNAFASLLAGLVSGLERDLKYATQDLKRLEKLLAEWKPSPEFA